MELYQLKDEAVHWIPKEQKWKLDSFGQPERVNNTPIPVIFPAEANSGLWGNVGIVQGYKRFKPDPKYSAFPRLWLPTLLNRTFYSEVLDTWMGIVVTERTLDLIDEHFGFDHYILATHELHLKSTLGMRLKRKMMQTLFDKDTKLYPNDPVRREEVYRRYKHHIPADLTRDQLEWFGLTLGEACLKQAQIERLAAEKGTPLKYEFARELISDVEREMSESTKSAAAN